MQLPLTVKLQPSRSLSLLLIAMHFGAFLAIVVIALPVWTKLALTLFIATSFWSGRNCLGGGNQIVCLTLRDDGALEHVRFNDEYGEASVHLQSTVTPLLTVILLKQKSNILETLALLPDSLSPDDYRRLRLWLRWQPKTY